MDDVDDVPSPFLPLPSPLASKVDDDDYGEGNGNEVGQKEMGECAVEGWMLASFALPSPIHRTFNPKDFKQHNALYVYSPGVSQGISGTFHIRRETERGVDWNV